MSGWRNHCRSTVELPQISRNAFGATDEFNERGPPCEPLLCAEALAPSATEPDPLLLIAVGFLLDSCSNWRFLGVFRERSSHEKKVRPWEGHREDVKIKQK